MSFRKSLCGVLVAIFLFLFASCGEEQKVVQKPLEVSIIKVLQQDVELESVFTGETFGDADIKIAPRVTGWVELIHFREGSNVKEGDLLYTIDRQPYLNKVDAAKGTLSEAQTLLAKTKSDLDMIEPLAKINAVSQRELVFVKANHEAAKGKLQAAEANLRNAEIELSYCEVTAPISGLIGISKVRVGDYVSPGPLAELNTISSLGQMRVRFTVSEQEFMRVTREIRMDSNSALKGQGKKVRLILSNGEVYPFLGSINIADRQVDPTTGAITIEALFNNPEGLLRPGQYARIVLVTGIRKQALLIPQRTVTEMQGMFQVYTVNDSSKVDVRIIKPGPTYKDAYVVEEGLKAGEAVIEGGTKLLRPGMQIVAKSTDWSPGLNENKSK